MLPIGVPWVPDCKPDYLRVALVLQEALDQAQSGKGHQRHGGDKLPFSGQSWSQITAAVGGGYLAGQYAKKMAEAMSLPADEGRPDLLGAIIEAALLVIYRDVKHDAEEPSPIIE